MRNQKRYEGKKYPSVVVKAYVAEGLGDSRDIERGPKRHEWKEYHTEVQVWSGGVTCRRQC